MIIDEPPNLTLLSISLSTSTNASIELRLSRVAFARLENANCAWIKEADLKLIQSYYKNMKKLK